jgi:PST family polysaccharide transporter
MSLYTTSNAFILGIFTNTTFVGYYSAGEKVIRAVQGLLAPVSQTVYPHICKLAAESRQAALGFIRKMARMVGIPAFILSIILLVFAPLISHVLFGRQFEESIPVLRIMSFLPFLIGLSNIFGIQTMLTFGLKETFTKILIWGSFLNIGLALVLVAPLKHVGISVSVLATEIFVTASMFAALEKRGLRIFREADEVISLEN